MDGGRELGARGRRLLAGLVDATAAVGVAALLALLVEPLASLAEPTPSAGTALAQGTAVLAVLMLPLVMLVGLEAWFGTSPGKALVGLRVRTVDGHNPGLRRSLSRTAYRVSPVGLVGASWALASGQGRPWHDEWTGTVVDPRRPPAPSPAELAPPASPATSPSAIGARGGRGAEGGHADSSQELPLPASRGHALAGAGPNPAERSATTGKATPAARARQRAACRCRDEVSFEGDEAVDYAGGHLRAVRRRPARGELVLVCPATRAVWLAREPWAAEAGVTTLERQGPVSEARPRRDAPAATPGA
ncbi:MAG: hypothetical protein GEV08_09170 [Acidimicrobiia bacterium]|nr:hypothetical protein [Acidimicrobiia bacterium]